MTDVAAGLDILTAGHRLRDRSITSTELTEQCLARIDALQASLNAFITVTADRARQQAAQADRELAAGVDRGPLHGIPISLKDLIHEAGVPTTAGSRVRPMAPVPVDATVTARLRAAGAVLVGKTNLHEFAFGTTSEDSAFGPPRHPRDPSRSPGGSSGGSAVSVATGMALGTIGTDTGGSVRLPAALCGLVGRKPDLDDVPTDGVVPLSRTLDHVGPLARTVADAAAIFDVLARRPPSLPAEVSAGALALGRLGGYFTDLLEPGVRAAWESAMARLAGAGVRLEERTVSHANHIATIYLQIVFPEAAAYHAETLDRCPERYTDPVRQRLEIGRYTLAEDYLRARRGQDVLRAEVDAALGGSDALVLPTLPLEAPRLGQQAASIGGRDVPVRALMLRLTQLFNLTGHPAITLPCGETPAGLPVGLQLVGRRHGTRRLLEVARTVERVLAAPRHN